MQFFYIFFFIIAVIIKLAMKSTSKVVEAGKDAFGDVFTDVKCHKCGKSNKKNDKFCTGCGTKLLTPNENIRKDNNSTSNTSYSTNKYCNKCGFENTQDTKFCIKCGSSNFTSVNIDLIENSVGGYIATLLAFIVKADNVISKAEADFIGEIFNRFADNNTQLREAFKIVFVKAKDNSIKNHKMIAKKLSNEINSKIDFFSRDSFTNAIGFYFMELVFIDGKLNQPQYKVVYEILKELEISDDEINNIKRSFTYENNSNNSRGSANSSKSHTLDNDYEILNCKKTDSDETIKKAYKDLAKQYHPDTISGKGLAEDFIKFANKRFQEINNAYDNIKKSRGMR